MRQPRRTMSRLCQCLATAFVFCQGPANAATVGVMADAATGRLYPAAAEARVAPAILELDMEPGDSVTVTGLVQSVFSDAPEIAEESILFNTNFPDARLEWEDIRGPATSVIVDPTGTSATFTGLPDTVQQGCFFLVSGDDTPHCITSRDDSTPPYSTCAFTPALSGGQTYTLSAIRAAVLDDYGLHSGEPTLGEIWQSIVASPTLGNNPALACSADGRIVFKTAYTTKVWRSRDGGDSWEELSASPILGDNPALACSADGRIVFKTANTTKVWRSRDGGDSWEELSASPPADYYPALACSADGRIVFRAVNNAKDWRSRDGGDSWEKLSSSPTLGNNPALSCSADGRIVFRTADNAKDWRSRDGGDSWEELSASPTLGNDSAFACSSDGRIVFALVNNAKGWRSRDGGDSWEELSASPTLNWSPALACSADGRIVFKTATGTTVYKATPLFGISSTAPYTVLIDAVPGVVEQVKDFYAVDLGERRAYWALRTGEDRYSVYDTGTDPIGWYDIAWKDGGTWYVRGTNGPVATAATSAAAAVSAACETLARNMAMEWQYQPHYGYAAFTGGTNVEWALTFVPDAYAVTNAPGVSAMGVLYSAYPGTEHWSMDAFRTDILSTNPTVSKVSWHGGTTVHAVIRYLQED